MQQSPKVIRCLSPNFLTEFLPLVGRFPPFAGNPFRAWARLY